MVGQVSLADRIENTYAYALAIGMPSDEFWNSDPENLMAYIKAYELKKKEQNRLLWLNGVYTCKALMATVVRSLSTESHDEYPSEPLPISKEDIEADKQRRIEELKVRIYARLMKAHSDWEESNKAKGGGSDA